MDMTVPPNVTWRRKVLLCSLGLFAGLLIPEIALRLLWKSHGHGLYRADPQGQTVYATNFDGEVYDAERNARVRVRTNDVGYIGNTYTPKKPHGAYRIAVLGDSYVAATQTDTDSNFVSLLEKTLNDSARTRFEVMNFGIDSQGTVEELARYHATVSDYDPDAIVLVFFPNDFLNNALYIPYVDRIRAAKPPWPSVPLLNNNVARRDLKFRLRRYSYLVRFADSTFRNHPTLFRLSTALGLQHRDVVTAPEDDVPLTLFIYELALLGNPKSTIDFTLELIERLQNDVRTDRHIFHFVYLPDPIQVDDTLWAEKLQRIASLRNHQWNRTQPNERIATIALRTDMSSLDLTPIFRTWYATHPDETLYNQRERHLTPEGHRYVATALAEYLRPTLKNRIDERGEH